MTICVDEVPSLARVDNSGSTLAMSINQRIKLPQTCFFWNQGRCSKSDEECKYQHARTGVVAPVPGAGDGQELTCYFWSTGRCHLPARECHYAHFSTGQVAPAPGGAWGAGTRQQHDAVWRDAVHGHLGQQGGQGRLLETGTLICAKVYHSSCHGYCKIEPSVCS